MSTDTREAILEAARATVQARGYNALSFRDLAAEVGIKSASVHYHFPTKGDLASTLAARYADEAQVYLDGLMAEPLTHEQRMAAYIAVFRAALERDNRMCLCGIMAAEAQDLPPPVLAEVDRFGEVNTRWLAQVLGERHPGLPPDVLRARALAIFAAMEGAQLVARGRSDVRVFDKVMAGYTAAGLLS